MSEHKNVENSLTEREESSMVLHLWSHQLNSTVVNVPAAIWCLVRDRHHTLVQILVLLVNPLHHDGQRKLGSL